jgi:hypothetical protein
MKLYPPRTVPVSCHLPVAPVAGWQDVSYLAWKVGPKDGNNQANPEVTVLGRLS